MLNRSIYLLGMTKTIRRKQTANREINMARKNTLTVRFDDENNAEIFVCELREKFPTIAATLCTAGSCDITRDEWAAIQKLEGFADGPAYARYALVVADQEDDGEQLPPEEVEA